MRVSKGNLTEECVGDGVFVYTLERGGVRAVFSNWGATLMSLCVPDAQGDNASPCGGCRAYSSGDFLP